MSLCWLAASGSYGLTGSFTREHTRAHTHTLSFQHSCISPLSSSPILCFEHCCYVKTVSCWAALYSAIRFLFLNNSSLFLKAKFCIGFICLVSVLLNYYLGILYSELLSQIHSQALSLIHLFGLASHIRKHTISFFFLDTSTLEVSILLLLFVLVAFCALESTIPWILCPSLFYIAFSF